MEVLHLILGDLDVSIFEALAEEEAADRGPRTGGSVGWASGCHAGGREFDSGRTNTQGLKITEENVLPF